MSRGVEARELFDADFLESLTRLRILATRVKGGGRHAEQRSRDLGSGIDFRDFRPYAAGDDLRAIDWNIYSRLGRVFVRLYEELEDLPLYVLPDVSGSAFLEQPPRARAGLRVSLALSAISLNQHDSVGVFPFAEDLSVLVRPAAGKRRVLSLAERLSSIEPGGATDFGKSLSRFGALGLREGMVAVVSDFFDPRGIEAVTAALGTLRHRLLLVQLTRKSDRDPDLAGDLRLVDCESGTAADVSISAATLDRYRAAYDRFQDGLIRFARRRGAGLLQLDVEAEVVPQLAAIFEGGRYVV